MLLITENAALKTEVAKLRHQLAVATQPLSETASTLVSAPAISVSVSSSSSPLPLPSPGSGPSQLSLPSQPLSQENRRKYDQIYYK